MKHLIWVLVLMAGTVMAQNETDQAAPPATPAPAASLPQPCASEQHHQFDFWIGEWDVTQGGQPAGHNIIKRIHNCALSENWTGAQGNTGSSLNIYDRTTGKWHQSWVDGSGTLLQLGGGLIDGKMVMSSMTRGADGSTANNRIIWAPNEDGSVLQTWDTSADGETWTTVFNGLYVKVANSE